MKKIIFLSILMAAFFAANTGMAAGAETPDAASLYGQTQSNSAPARIPPLLLADRTETDDQIMYGTDPNMEEAEDEQEREEKQKQEKSWEMLQNMNLYNRIGKQPTSTSDPNAPRQ